MKKKGCSTNAGAAYNVSRHPQRPPGVRDLLDYFVVRDELLAKQITWAVLRSLRSLRTTAVLVLGSCLTRNFLAILIISGFFPTGSLAFEVFVNGERVHSLKEYHNQERAEERKEARIDKAFASLKAQSQSSERQGVASETRSPFSFDPAKGKTIVIVPEGQLQAGNEMVPIPAWMAYDPNKGKTIELTPVSVASPVTPTPAGPAVFGVLPGVDKPSGPVVEAGQVPQVVDHGRVAGIQPPLSEVVEQFERSGGGIAAQRVSSPYALEEVLKKALEASDGGAILFVASQGKVRLLKLKGDGTEVGQNPRKNALTSP